MKKFALSIVFAAAASTTFSVTASAQTATLIVSRMGGKCLDVEGGTGKDRRLIGYPCTGNSNQIFKFHSDGTIRQGGWCVGASGGQGNDGDKLILWDCVKDAYGNPDRSQKWTRDSSNRLVGINGKCVDLAGGAGAWVLNGVWNQAVVIWPCKYENNQIWYRGEVFQSNQISNAKTIYSGDQTVITPFTNVRAGGVNTLIGQDGTSIVAGGGGNIVATDGATIVAAGGGNIIAGGAGNVVVVTKLNQ